MALGELYGIYCHPVYCCIRRRGHDHHAAQDLAQAYFISWLERNYSTPERSAVFLALSPLLDKPAADGMYDAAAVHLGMDARSVRVAMHRLRERLGIALQQLVADTLENPTPEEIKDELRYLFSVLTVDA